MTWAQESRHIPATSVKQVRAAASDPESSRAHGRQKHRHRRRGRRGSRQPGYLKDPRRQEDEPEDGVQLPPSSSVVGSSRLPASGEPAEQEADADVGHLDGGHGHQVAPQEVHQQAGVSGKQHEQNETPLSELFRLSVLTRGRLLCRGKGQSSHCCAVGREGNRCKRWCSGAKRPSVSLRG